MSGVIRRASQHQEVELDVLEVGWRMDRTPYPEWGSMDSSAAEDLTGCINISYL